MYDITGTHNKIFRNFALPEVTFDYLKQFQRAYQVKHEISINNNQALAILLSEHQQHNKNEKNFKVIKPNVDSEDDNTNEQYKPKNR